MEGRREIRDKTRNVRRPENIPPRGSYAEQRMLELKKERELFNVDQMGFYRGGGNENY